MMLELTFAEQVKLVLGRKNMTIKQLAEEIEAKTGMKMSRQNLTQRLGRDNFQEKDMKMIAEILECPFHLSILGEVAEPVIVKEEVVEKVIEKVVEKTATAKKKEEEEFKPIKEIVKHPMKELTSVEESSQREVTVGEIVDEPMKEVVKEPEVKLSKEQMNPYTGYEYKTNTVRVHPTRIGYVQVYDRKDHKWTEMTEWAFLGFQERQKLILGKAYQEPTYID